jgi:hypothetical protein
MSLFNPASVDDVVMAGRRLFGLGKSKEPRWEGKIPSDEFFAAAKSGDPRALASLKEMNYRAPWRLPFLRKGVANEIVRGKARTGWGKLVPRGVLTGYKYQGIGRFASNFHKTPMKGFGGIGLATTVFAAASAPRGQMANSVVKSAAGNIGGLLGAAVGGMLGNLPGELVGGWLGTEIAEKAVAPFDLWQKAMNQTHQLNFGGGYQDSQQAFTMRQRAIQEMGSSALNARQYLGREAALMHS